MLLRTFRVRSVSEVNKELPGAIDGGSQKSFVAEDLSLKLRLPIVDDVELRMNTHHINEVRSTG